LCNSMRAFVREAKWSSYGLGLTEIFKVKTGRRTTMQM